MLFLVTLALASEVEEATRLHLAGDSVTAAELLIPVVDEDAAAALALGRVFFAHQQWQLAEAAYHRVPRDHPAWLRSRLEATWAAFYADATPDRALARTLLLLQEHPGEPELRYLLSVLGLYCQYGETEPVVKELASELQALPDQHELFEAAEILSFEWYDRQPWHPPSPDGCDERDGTMRRALRLTLAGHTGRRLGRGAPGACALHPRCRDPRRHRRLDREAWTWLESYRPDLA